VIRGMAVKADALIIFLQDRAAPKRQARLHTLEGQSAVTVEEWSASQAVDVNIAESSVDVTVRADADIPVQIQR
jgi:hypothetical protein